MAALAVFCIGPAPAHSAVYSYQFRIATSNGVPVGKVALFATGGGQSPLQFSPIIIPASGTYAIMHDLSFDADAVTVLGVANRPAGGFDVVQFTNPEFAGAATGSFFGGLFPGDASFPRHSELAAALLTGEADRVEAFLAPAAVTFFDPSGPFKILEYSVAIGGNIPVPAGIFLLGPLIGAGLIAAATRRRSTR